MAVQYAKAIGYRVIGIDSGESKKKLVEGYGADVFIDFQKEVGSFSLPVFFFFFSVV